MELRQQNEGDDLESTSLDLAIEEKEEEMASDVALNRVLSNLFEAQNRSNNTKEDEIMIDETNESKNSFETKTKKPIRISLFDDSDDIYESKSVSESQSEIETKPKQKESKSVSESHSEIETKRKESIKNYSIHIDDDDDQEEEEKENKKKSSKGTRKISLFSDDDSENEAQKPRAKKSNQVKKTSLFDSDDENRMIDLT